MNREFQTVSFPEDTAAFRAEGVAARERAHRMGAAARDEGESEMACPWPTGMGLSAAWLDGYRGTQPLPESAPQKRRQKASQSHGFEMRASPAAVKRAAARREGRA
jgi:ribosome modulation factor